MSSVGGFGRVGLVTLRRYRVAWFFFVERARRFEIISNDDRAQKRRLGFTDPDRRAFSRRHDPVEYGFTGPRMPFFLKFVSCPEWAVGAVDVMRRGQPFRPGIGVGDVIKNHVGRHIDENVMVAFEEEGVGHDGIQISIS